MPPTELPSDSQCCTLLGEWLTARFKLRTKKFDNIKEFAQKIANAQNSGQAIGPLRANVDERDFLRKTIEEPDWPTT